MKKRNYAEFDEALKKVHPDLQLIQIHTNNKGKVIVKDTLDIVYECSPGNLLMGKYPTIVSAVDKTLAFNKKLQVIFPNLKILNYIQGNKKVLVIDEMDIIYKVSPAHLLLGNYPSIQTATNKEEAFIKLATIIHDAKYSYPELKYLGMNNKIDILCSNHGIFKQNPSNHLQGQGCRKCADILMSSKGWTKSNWIECIKKGKGRIAKLYVLNLWNDKESFIKIGITSTSVEKRFLSKLPYSYDILSIKEGKSDIIFEQEKELHLKLKQYKYIPKLRFGGMYECYKIEKQILIKERLL